MLEELRAKNKELMIYDVHDDHFKQFGRVLDSIKFQDAINYLKTHTSCPNEGNHYLAHDEEFEKALKTLKPYEDVFGQVRLQYGYVNGYNQMLNALEYHKSPEINIAVSPFVLMLGHTSDIHHNTYDTKQVTAFFLPSETVVEIFPNTLHFSPCRIEDSGFKCGVVLPYSTNMEFIKKNNVPNENGDRLLFKTNKWLLCHQEHHKFVELGAHIGLQGINYKINY